MRLIETPRNLDKLLKKTMSVQLLLLSMVFFVSSAVLAESWNPEDALMKYLRQNYPWADVSVENVILTGEVPAAPLEKIMVEKTPPGRTVFLLEFEDGTKVTATATVKAFDKMVLSRGGFRKGYTLKRDDVYSTLAEVQRIPDGTVKDVEQVVGKQLARSVISNMQITSSMVNETPVVKRGQKVTLLVESDNFRITALGEVRENGSVGRYVKALNLVSRKTVTGILVDENTVKVGL